MTLRLLKKLRTTVPTFRRRAKLASGPRGRLVPRLLGLTVAVTVVTFGCDLASEVAAQSPGNGYNLKWRTSKKVLPQPHYVTSGDVFAKDDSIDAPPRRVHQEPPGAMQSVRTAQYYGSQQSPQASVRQSGWSEDGRFEYPDPAPAPGADNARATRDFFSNPFGKNQAGQNNAGANARSGNIAQLEFPADSGGAIEPSNNLRGGAQPAPPSNFQVPNAGATAEQLPEGALPSGQPALGDPPQGGGLFDSLLERAGGSQSNDPPVREAAEPDVSPLKDLLPAGPGTGATDRVEPPGESDDDVQPLPPPMRDRADEDDPESASDREEEFNNPFDRNRDRANQEDLERLRKRMERQRAETEQKNKETEAEEAAKEEQKREVPKGLTCDEFRVRLSRESIRTVSLDISPPFRPDVFSQKEYDELKSKFDENQFHRPWYSVDGLLLGNGRLTDLAYEKAVIENDQGVKQQIDVDRLSEGDLAYISKNWGLPGECRLQAAPYTERMWTRTIVTWKASALCHKPLYFEEVNLERYGHTAGPILQPIVSSAHFFANIAVLPYKAGIHPPNECQYALGYYRPGDCAPWIVPPVPLSLRGAAAQLAAVTTGFWLIP